MFKSLRPAGNKVHFESKHLADNLLSPYKFKLYQSGTAALSAALIAAQKVSSKITNKAKVLLPAYACPDLVSAILHSDAEPILIDFASGKPWMDLSKIEEMIDEDVIAIIMVNFLGIPERIEQIRSIIDKQNIVLIEDSAQGFPNKSANEYWNGDIIISSFGRGKPIGLLGGGIALSKNEILLDALPQTRNTPLNLIDKLKYFLKSHLYNILLKPPFYYWISRVPGIQLGQTYYKALSELDSCPGYIKKLITNNFARYKNQKLISQEIHNLLKDLNSSQIIDLPATCNFNFNSPLLRYPILVTDSNIHSEILIKMTRKGLGVSTMYNDVLPNISGIPGGTFSNKTELLNAELFSKQLLTLPTHEDVTTKDIESIKEILQKFLS